LGEKRMDPTTFAGIVAAANTRDQWLRADDRLVANAR
jgi:hypothetical protein